MMILQTFRYGSALASALLLILPCASAREGSSPPAIVTRYCSGCHGVEGNSQLPYIPRLAGLNAGYLQSKLTTFRAARSSTVDEAFNLVPRMFTANGDTGLTASAAVHMVGVANAVNDNDRKAAAEWYATRQPAPGKNRKGKMIEEGARLYLYGVESRDIPACQTCHGPEAEGKEAAPRLAGQNAAYLSGQLDLFRASNRQHSPMTDVARSLGSDQARAVAVYLQSR